MAMTFGLECHGIPEDAKPIFLKIRFENPRDTSDVCFQIVEQRYRENDFYRRLPAVGQLVVSAFPNLGIIYAGGSDVAMYSARHPSFNEDSFRVPFGVGVKSILYVRGSSAGSDHETVKMRRGYLPGLMWMIMRYNSQMAGEIHNYCISDVAENLQCLGRM